ncbi:Guanine nucleotide exchange factor DBS [Bagarius yarrelli]|uniref:Guanine nucleotide exchange factor DBS n=1 Tax=Bagarius yarrelli TaxID=175774 RepID=A0A556TKQ1_BAGYA|nr:Guanine nucleotide exchange factor DBS [Bagarius yarrelli]
MALNRVSLLCQDITRLWLQLKVTTDEIMQQETSPLCAADISPDLRKCFAFLSGGRGENGSPIIVFPEYSTFTELQEEEFHNVLNYLTSVPSLSASGVGFILIIDRRQDRWASVKGTLLRIAGSFPGNLQLVLVLRPAALFQRALSDFLFKFSKDEFKMKVPVIMLSSVTELHSYIDRSQLTQELGGTQEYCHEKWISHRTAIEGFALMVKKTAQTLQAFGTELAETELPNDVEATSNLLSAHTEKKDKMKEDLKVALGQGGLLLDSINEPLMLLGQLDETETAFDDFWDKHQTKLEQCLQLRYFEQSFREVRAQLDQVADKLSGFSEVGISPAHGEHILKDLTNHEERTCVTRWCEDGIYLLASQSVDKCQSQDGAEAALQEIERYLETTNQHKLTDLTGIWKEYESVLTTDFRDQVERVFQKQLSMEDMFEKRRVSLKKLAAKQTRPVQPVAPRPEAIIKSPMSSPVHKERNLSSEIINSRKMTDLQIYEKYCQNKPRSESLWRQCSDCAFFQGNLNELGRLLMQGSFSVWTEHKKGHAKVKDLARFKPMQRHLFLHEKAMLFCKRREENGEGYEKAPSYSFKNVLNMSVVGITENVKADSKKFEIWCNSREEVYIVQAPTAEIKMAWVSEIRKVLTGQLKACREAIQQKTSEQLSPLPTSVSLSPFKTNYKSQKKAEEKKSESTLPELNLVPAMRNSDKVKDDSVTSPTADRAAVAKKRFTLQGFSNLKSQKGITGFQLFPVFNTQILALTLYYALIDDCRETGPLISLSRDKWLSTSSLVQTKRRGFSKASLSMDASEENDGYSSGEDPLNSDPEDEGRKLSPGKYIVVADYDKGTQDLTVKTGDMVQLVREGADGQWYAASHLLL